MPAMPAAVPLFRISRPFVMLVWRVLHVFLVEDAEADENEAVEDHETRAEGDEEREDDGFYRVVEGCCGHCTNTGGLESDSSKNLPSLMAKFLAAGNHDSTN